MSVMELDAGRDDEQEGEAQDSGGDDDDGTSADGKRLCGRRLSDQENIAPERPAQAAEPGRQRREQHESPTERIERAGDAHINTGGEVGQAGDGVVKAAFAAEGTEV